MHLLITSVLALLTSPALSGTLERLAQLPTCDPSFTGTSLCGTGPSYTNDIFQCASDSTWTLKHTCIAADAPCSHGSCNPLPTPCSSGTTKCATLRSHGYQGVVICRNGKWEMDQECACGEFHGQVKCVGPKLMGTGQEGCKVGELKCVAENGQGRGGAVYRCNEQGMWRVVMECTGWERCVEVPVPHCTWV